MSTGGFRQAFRSASKSDGVLVAGGTMAFITGCTITYISSQRYQQDINETNQKLYGGDVVDGSATTTGSTTTHHGGSCQNCSAAVYSFVNDPNRSNTFQKVASIYDKKIDRDEFVMGINLLRRSLLYWHSKGNVLEVGAGTGRNIKYYPKNSSVNRVILMDKSDLMLQEAKAKLKDIANKKPWFSFLSSSKNESSNNGSSTKNEAAAESSTITISANNSMDKPQFACIVGDCEKDSSIVGKSSSSESKLSNKQQDHQQQQQQRLTSLQQFPSNTFDTIVDTFGLCSYNDPVIVLRELSRICKPNGKILLLEHGRSNTYNFITNYLDKHAERHAKNWGCVWNRDIDTLITKDSSSFMKIDTYHTFHFGTTYYMVCSPVKEAEKGILK